MKLDSKRSSLEKRRAVFVIGRHAFLEAVAVLGEEFRVVLGLALGLFVEELEEAAREHAVELLHERGVLHGLARDVQGEVFAVHHAAQEAQPFREEPLGLGLDEHLAAVEVHFAFAPRHPELLKAAARHEQERADGEWRVGVEMEPVGGRLGVVADVFVKLGVFLFLDLALVAGPDGLRGVDRFAVEGDGEGDEVRVPLDDLADAVRLGELLILEVEQDRRAARQVGGGLDLVAGLAVGLPFPAVLARFAGAGGDGHFVRRHEGRVEADAELPDEAGVPLAGLELFEKRA